MLLEPRPSSLRRPAKGDTDSKTEVLFAAWNPLFFVGPLGIAPCATADRLLSPRGPLLGAFADETSRAFFYRSKAPDPDGEKRFVTGSVVRPEEPELFLPPDRSALKRHLRSRQPANRCEIGRAHV